MVAVNATTMEAAFLRDADHIGEGDDEKEVGAEEEVNDEASGDAGDRYNE